MHTPDKTIDHGTLRGPIAASAQIGAEGVGAEGVGGASGGGVAVHCGRASQTLAATRGTARTWRQFETLAGYLKDLGIVEYRDNAAAYEPRAAAGLQGDKLRATASERMKRAHQAAAHDAWFREQVQASIDDPQAAIRLDLDFEVKAAHARQRPRSLPRRMPTSDRGQAG